jgi:hypothetical protein
VLVVVDQVAFRVLVEEAPSSEGFEARTAGTLGGAKEKLATWSPDVVLPTGGSRTGTASISWTLIAMGLIASFLWIAEIVSRTGPWTRRACLAGLAIGATAMGVFACTLA